MTTTDTTSSAPVKGSCSCGAIRFSVQLPSLFCAHCHCSMCRRSHGAGFVTWFSVPREQLSFDAGSTQLTLFRSSEHGTRSFCGHCGSTLFFETTQRPDAVDIVLANMHDPIDRPPQLHVHCDDRAAWIVLDGSLPRLGGDTGLEPIESEDDSG